MRSAITPPTVNRLEWNLELCEPNVWGWTWQIFVATVWEGVKIFGEVNNAPFYRFPVAQILRHLNTTTSIGEAVKTFETEFWKFYHNGSFFQKSKNCSQNFLSRSCDSGRHNSAMFTNVENSRPNGPPTGCLVSIFTVKINSKSFPWDVRCAQENTSNKD